MIRVFNNVDETLNVYRNNKVVVWGAGVYGKRIYTLLKMFDTDIYAYCDNNELLWDTVEINSGIPIISPIRLKELIKENHDIVIQIGCLTKDNSLQQQIQELMGDKHICISLQEARSVLEFLNKDLLDKNLYKKIGITQGVLKHPQAIRMEDLYKYMYNEPGKTAIVICSPAKTGNYTLQYTFDDLNLKYACTWHNPGLTNVILANRRYNKVKLVVGMREPIAQNISLLYQYIASAFDAIGCRMVLENLDEWSKICKGNGDVQVLFNQWLQALGYIGLGSQCRANENILCENIQSFIPEFQEQVLDIMKEPFDKEKGYSIIKEGRIEVFVYQLEKMNEIIEPFSKFIGIPFKQWTKANEASEKWVADSYKQAQQELKFSKEYFDKCYNEPYVKHFYNEEDIEKFKNKWRKNIVQEGQ